MATSQRVNGSYETLVRGNNAKVWVTEADGVTPLVGEVSSSKSSSICYSIMEFFSPYHGITLALCEKRSVRFCI